MRCGRGRCPAFKEPSKQLGGLTTLDAYVPILIAFVLAMLALNALPPVLAGYREKGILRRLSTTPVGAVRVLAAQLAIQLAVAVVTLVLRDGAGFVPIEGSNTCIKIGGAIGIGAGISSGSR